jgi:hypothetical protein
MKNLDRKNIENLLAKDYIRRNTQLSVFIQLINSLEGSHILAVDGEWGSGKTVFVRQLELLCESNEVIKVAPGIEQHDIDELRSTYTTIYYNAWENDYCDDALQSILYNLVAKIDKTHGGLMENSRKKASSKVDISALVKNLSHDGVVMNGKTDDEKLTSGIRAFVDRKDRINKSLRSLIDQSEKRILFIIDELDRCSPAFAVKILETIKHYFEIDGIVFVLAINTEQLAHTVKNFYGNEFDGYGYLNKFFDFPFTLKDPDVEAFTRNYLGKPQTRDIGTKTPLEVVNFLNMKMRQIESYYKSLDLIKAYTQRQGFYDDENIEYIVQFIFVPLALALKIKSGDGYSSFVSGKNSSILDPFLSVAPDSLRLARSVCSDKRLKISELDESSADDITKEFVIETYRSMFVKKKSHYAKEAYDAFKDATSIIGYYTTIEPKVAEVLK